MATNELETLFQALGSGLIIMIVLGVLCRAVRVHGRRRPHRGRKIATGVIGALPLPFLMTLVPTGALAAAWLLLTLFPTLSG